MNSFQIGCKPSTAEAKFAFIQPAEVIIEANELASPACVKGGAVDNCQNLSHLSQVPSLIAAIKDTAVEAIFNAGATAEASSTSAASAVNADATPTACAIVRAETTPQQILDCLPAGETSACWDR